jgi:hypothetical protein
MRKLALARVLALALALGLAAACSRSEAPPAPPKTPETLPGVQAAPPVAPSPAAAAKRVAAVALGSALDPAKGVVAPKSTFAPTDTIYASVTTVGWDAPVTLVARWSSEDGRVVSESTQKAEVGPSTTEFHIANPQGLAVGSYQVEILADGASAGVQRFEVR